MILTQVLLFASISIIKWAMLKGTPLPAERRSDRPRSLLRTLAPLQLLGRARRPPSRRLMRPCLPLQARRWRRSHLRASRACARGQPHSSLSANGPNRPCSTTLGCPPPLSCARPQAPHIIDRGNKRARLAEASASTAEPAEAGTAASSAGWEAVGPTQKLKGS